MVDFPDSSVSPVEAVSRANDHRHDNDIQQKKKRPLVKPGKVEDAEDPETHEQEHSLDLDA